MKSQLFPSVTETGCERIRVAQGDVAAVDRCDCGMFQVHLAAFTLRLAPEALASLVGTLGQAVASSAARETSSVAARWSKS